MAGRSPEETLSLDERIRTAVADRYSTIGSDPAAEASIPVGRSWAERLGYPPELLDSVPACARAPFTGIGAPVLFADLSPGDRVLDLGCSAGLDTVLVVNGLFNLAPDKGAVASEVHRVLRPGGRLVGAEIVTTDDRPPGQLDPEGWFR